MRLLQAAVLQRVNDSASLSLGVPDDPNLLPRSTDGPWKEAGNQVVAQGTWLSGLEFSSGLQICHGPSQAVLEPVPKDVKCRSTWETGSSIQKDFKDICCSCFRCSSETHGRAAQAQGEPWDASIAVQLCWMCVSNMNGMLDTSAVPHAFKSRSH